jgi:hypothetical protein
MLKYYLNFIELLDLNSNLISKNLELPFGQHRWIEYKNIHDFDATMIQPE